MSDENRIPLRNPEGYMDLTTHDALTNVMRETEEADLRCQLRRDIEATYHYDYPDDGKECPFAGMTIGGSCEKVEEDADDSEKE